MRDDRSVSQVNSTEVVDNYQKDAMVAWLMLIILVRDWCNGSRGI